METTTFQQIQQKIEPQFECEKHSDVIINIGIIQRYFNLLCDVNDTTNVHVPDLALEIGIKKTTLMAYIHRYPYLFKTRPNKRHVYESDHNGLILDAVYLHKKDNPITEEYMAEKIKSESHKIYLNPLYNLYNAYETPGDPHKDIKQVLFGYVISPDRQEDQPHYVSADYGGYRDKYLWRNTEKKMMKINSDLQFILDLNQGTIDYMNLYITKWDEYSPSLIKFDPCKYDKFQNNIFLPEKINNKHIIDVLKEYGWDVVIQEYVYL